VLATRDDARLLASVIDRVAEPEEFGRKVKELYATDHESLDVVAFKDGRMIERFSRPLLRGASIAGRVWSLRDITEQKRAEDVLRRQARYDALTSTLNHASVTQALRDLAAASGESIGVV